MTKNRKIKHLEKQNKTLRKKNKELRSQIPTREYIKKMNKSFDEFENINEELLKLYKELHKDRIRGKKHYWKYQFGILKIHIKQKLNL